MKTYYVKSGSNNPPVIVELTPELADFVIENCDSNLAMGFNVLQGTQSRDVAERVVVLVEKFKALKAAVERARE